MNALGIVFAIGLIVVGFVGWVSCLKDSQSQRRNDEED